MVPLHSTGMTALPPHTTGSDLGASAHHRDRPWCPLLPRGAGCGCDAVRCDRAGRGCGVLCLRREWVRCRVKERGVAPKRFNGQLEGTLVLRGLYGDA